MRITLSPFTHVLLTEKLRTCEESIALYIMGLLPESHLQKPTSPI